MVNNMQYLPPPHPHHHKKTQPLFHNVTMLFIFLPLIITDIREEIGLS